MSDASSVTWDYQQAYNLAIQAGATPDEAHILAAIAGAESGYNPHAHYQPGTGENSYGLWQINMDAKYAAGRRKQFGIASNEDLFDPVVNAKAALAILRSQGWKAWTTYTSGKYKQFMPGGVASGSTYSGASTAGPSGAGPSGGATLPPGASAQEIETFIRQHYPGEAGFLDVPEIRDVLLDEARKGGDEQELLARLEGTQWWKDHSATTRNFLALKATDPAEAEAEIQRKMADIRGSYGFDNLGSDVSLRAIAEAALTYGWNEQQIKDNLAGHQEYDLAHTGLKTGSVNEVEAVKLQQMATAEYFVPMDTQTAQKWAVDIYEGKQTEDSYREYLSNIAAARFPGLKEQGITPGMYMAPIVNTIANTLEIQPGDINLADPKYSAILSVQDPNGQVRPMNLSEAQRWARSQPGFLATQNAKDTAASFSETLAQTFGQVAS